ncbi:MAG: hypothetical protein J1E98_13510 [Lachnospiraceae bacterium]|nr:hypothetical protein [Lachnospiraceae bacterium]
MKFNTDLVKTNAVFKVYITPDDVNDYMRDSTEFGKIISRKVKEVNKELTANVVENIAVVNICFNPDIPHFIQFGMIKKIGNNAYAAYTKEDIPYLLYRMKFFTNINAFMIKRLRKVLYFPEFLGEIKYTTKNVLNTIIERNFE